MINKDVRKSLAKKKRKWDSHLDPEELNTLFGVYQDWLHQNSVNNLDGGIKEGG